MSKDYSVLEVLFPKVRAEILRLLFRPPYKERYVRELMGVSGLSLSTVQDELRKLSALHLVSSRSDRYHRFYRANRKHPLSGDLIHMVQISEQSARLSHGSVRPGRGVRRPARKIHRLPPNRPINWHLFSKKAYQTKQT